MNEDWRSRPRPGGQGIMHRGFVMSEDSPRKRTFAAKRAQYAELRGQGKTPSEAARELGLDPLESARRYERWYQAFPPPEVTK